MWLKKWNIVSFILFLFLKPSSVRFFIDLENPSFASGQKALSKIETVIIVAKKGFKDSGQTNCQTTSR